MLGNNITKQIKKSLKSIFFDKWRFIFWIIFSWKGCWKL